MGGGLRPSSEREEKKQNRGPESQKQHGGYEATGEKPRGGTAGESRARVFKGRGGQGEVRKGQ